MQSHGITNVRRLLALLLLAVVVLVGGGRPTFAEGLEETGGGPGLSAQALTLSSPDFSAQDLSQRQPDFQTQDHKAKDISQGTPEDLKAKDAKGQIGSQGYDWSDGD